MGSIWVTLAASCDKAARSLKAPLGIQFGQDRHRRSSDSEASPWNSYARRELRDCRSNSRGTVLDHGPSHSSRKCREARIPLLVPAAVYRDTSGKRPPRRISQSLWPWEEEAIARLSLQLASGMGFGMVGHCRRRRSGGASATDQQTEACSAFGRDHAAAPACGDRRQARGRG